MKSLQNLLMFLNENFVTIIICIGLIIGIVQKIKNYFTKSDDEKVEIAKSQIKEIILNLVYDAEIEFENWDKAGSIKRAQVIEKIYKDYPILSKVVDQSTLTKWIDETIDDSLKVLRKVISDDTTETENE